MTTVFPCIEGSWYTNRGALFSQLRFAGPVRTRLKSRRRFFSHPMSADGGAGQRRLAAIMFSDIVGYTAMTQINEKLALEVLETHRRLLRPIFAKHGGTEIKTIGDAFLVEFRSALDAVNCAVEMQQALARHNRERTPLTRVQIRIGIHVGDVVGRESDVYGDTVNIASRIEKLAESGGIAVSAQVYEQTKNKVAFPISKMGDFRLKNVENTAPVYAVSSVWTGVQARKPDTSNRIAVLPLRNIGGNQDDEYLVDGLTEELVSSLSSVPGFKVIARTSMMRFKDSGKSISEIGKEVNAGNVLEGSVRRAGERVRISVQLIETDTEEYIWSGKYDRGLEDVLSIQEKIAEDAATALKTKLGEQKVPSSRRSITTNGDAYILYLKGRYALARHTQSDVEEAARFFKQAIAADPRFASAYAMYAQCRLFLGFFGFIPSKKAFEEALPSLSRAIEIDGDLDVAHMLMGRLLMDRDWDWAGSEAELRRAIELSPNSAEAHYRYALLLHDLGRVEEAIAEVKTAEDLDPLSVAVNQVAGTVLYYAGSNAEAKEMFQRAIAMEPRAALSHTNLGLVLFQDGDLEGSLAEIQNALQLDPNNYFFKADLCFVYSRSGRTEDARRLLAESESRAATEHVPAVAIAGMCSCLGESARAIELLERAYAEHSGYLASLNVERWFDNIRNDPGFVSILRRVGLS
jgi:adenylate cyclase